MEVWKAAVLGLVQGLTEFLPVSSSGHLLLFERILGADTGGADLFLGVMLHAGTLAALLLLYAPRLWRILREDRKMLLFLAAGTLPAALAGVLLGEITDEMFFGGKWLWLTFAATGVLLILCGRAKQNSLPLTMRRALFVGGAQAFAILPGLSRSGTTLAAGMLCGMDREKAADFSFLLAIPVVAGAVCLELVKAIGDPLSVSAIPLSSLAVGTLCAALAGLFSVKWMLRLVKTRALWGFSVYLFALSACLLACEIFL